MSVNRAHLGTIVIPDLPVSVSADIEPLFDSAAFVRLSNEPEATLGGINQIVLRDSTLIVRDCYGTKTVKLFDLSGAYLGNVGNHGRGPGEYSEPTHMEVAADGKIVIWDQFLDRLSFYAPTGDFLYSKEVPFLCMKFQLLEDDRYLFYAINSDNGAHPEIDGYTLIECDSALNPVSGGLYRKKDTYWSLLYDRNFFKNDSVVYYLPVYCDTIYAVYPDSRIEARLAFDFGKRTVPERLRVGRHRRTWMREQELENYEFMGGDFFLTKNHLQFSYTKGRNRIDCIYDFRNENLVAFAGRSGFFPLYFGNFVGSTDNALIGYFFPAMFTPRLKGWDTIPYKDVVRQFGKQRADLCLSMREDDNPVVTLFYYK